MLSPMTSRKPARQGLVLLKCFFGAVDSCCELGLWELAPSHKHKPDLTLWKIYSVQSRLVMLVFVVA